MEVLVFVLFPAALYVALRTAEWGRKHRQFRAANTHLKKTELRTQTRME